MSTNKTASLTIENLGSISETINEGHFGANMLFHTDRTAEGSDFEQLVESSGINSIRYPGGTISEQFFDPANPNETVGQNYFHIRSGRQEIGSREILPLTDYLEFVHGINGTATIVFPTFRYFDHNTRSLSAGAEAEITEFITALLSEEFGPIDHINIEIGNEWYQSNFDWTAAEFGRLQAEIARVISEVAETLELRGQVNIFAQGDADADDNATLASFFDGVYSTHLDGVLAHIYGANSQGNTLGIGGAIQPRLNGMMQAWDAAVNAELMLAITEWNVGESGEDSTLINGLMRSAPLLRMFAEMMQAEVDVAHIWSMQTAGPAGLSGREGTGSEWSPTGYLYNMLMDGASGSQLVDTGTSFRLRDDTNAVVGYTYTFSQSDRTDVFLSSGVDYDLSFNVDLVGMVNDASHIYVTVLTAEPGTTGLEYNATAALEFITGLEPNGGAGASEELSLLLGAYETVQITLTYGTGVNLTADLQIAISDELFGSDFGDTIDGGLGSDSLFGFGGRDVLSGGGGDDSIYGGSHHDTVFGDDGNDVVEGGQGRDSLYGGSGDDFISGGDWHDSIWGGGGSDSLYGDTGNDHIFGGAADDFIFGGEGNDSIDGGDGRDFILGEGGNDRITGDGSADTIDGGEGVDTLSLTSIEIGVTVWTGYGLVEIGLEQIQYNNIEIIETTDFADRISLIGHVQQVFSFGGDDSLQIWEAENASAYLGSGDDQVYAFGGYGNHVHAGDGEDYFFISYGSSTFFGGSGNDVFLLFSPLGTTIGYQRGNGDDVVSNFEPGRDTLLIEQELQSSLTIERVNNGTSVRFDDDSSILLLGVYETDLGGSFDFF